LLATVKLLRMGSKMTDTELAAGVISSMLMGAIESPFDHSTARDLLAEDNQLSAYQGNRAAFHDQRAISFGGLRMPTLFPGEKLHLFQNQRVQGVLDAFIGLVDRRLTASLGGVTLAQITRDYSKANYSSLRAAIADAWKGLTAARGLFAAGFCTPRFLAWLEEKVMTGALPLPDGVSDFYQAYPHLVVCVWRGPGRGVVDPTKEAQGAQMRMDAMVSTLDAEAAEMGLDWEDVLEQRAREIDRMRELGIPEPQWAMVASSTDPGSESEGAGEGDDA
jgi:lambda family phage portal protein